MIRVLSNSRLMSRRTIRDGPGSLFDLARFFSALQLSHFRHITLSHFRRAFGSLLSKILPFWTPALRARRTSATLLCLSFPVSFVVVVYKDTSKQDSMDLWFFSSSSLGLLLATVSPPTEHLSWTFPSPIAYSPNPCLISYHFYLPSSRPTTLTTSSICQTSA